LNTVWNKELLYVGGFLARAAYDNELKTVQQLWDAASNASSPPTAEIQTQLVSRVLHSLKFFDFYDSQPSKEVTANLREAFFACSSNANFPMISTTGVQMSNGIRQPDPLLVTFMKNVPMLPDEILANNLVIIEHLKHNGMIRNIEFPDIIRELQSRPLTLDECIACIKWWVTESRKGLPANRESYVSIRTQFLNAIVMTIRTKDNEPEKIIPMNSIKHFFNSKSPTTGSIPLDGPLPNDLLPIVISKHFKPEDLSAYFPWVEFNLHHWLVYISNTESGAISLEFNLCLSPLWAERVIGVISRSWSQLSDDLKATLKETLRDKTCIPTTNGMKKPADAYFPTVSIFPDLAIAKFPSNLPIRGNVERVLQYFDVRKHVNLQLIFNRYLRIVSVRQHWILIIFLSE
jgi:hypothetical protein